MKTQLFAVIVTALAVTSGCKSHAPESSSTQTTSASEPAATDKTPLAAKDREFLTKAAQGGMLEVSVGRIASRNAASPEVKAFGDRMVSEHSAANDELKALATSKGATVPTELDKDHQAMVDKLSKLSGPKLDKAYVGDMVEDHEDDVKEFREAAKELKDPELRAWAAKELPILESHLAHVRTLEKKTK
jgi:putative membrane protein